MRALLVFGIAAGCGRIGFDPIPTGDAWTLIETSSERVMGAPLEIPSTGAGNLIVVAVQTDDSNAATGVTDNTGNAYEVIAGSRAMAPGDGLAVELWYARNSLPGATSISAVAPPPLYSLTHWEVSGIRTTSPLDQVAQLDNQPTTNTPASPSITTSELGQLIITVAIVENVVSGIETGSAFTNDHETFGNGFAHLTNASAAPATYVARWNQPNSGTYCATAASFFAGP